MHWDKVFEDGRDFRVMNQLLLEMILAQIGKSPGCALDIGCGTGDLAVKLALRNYSVEAIDVSVVALGKAAERAEAAGVSLKTYQADLNSTWPVIYERFDLITCKLVMAFIEDKESFLAKVAKLLGPEGVFLLITPVLHEGHEYTPRWRGISIPAKELDDMLGKRFEQVDLVHEDYVEELGHEKYLLLTNPKNVGKD